MNTYSKFCPNVYVAKCTEKHEKGDLIIVTTRNNYEHECIVFNLVNQKDEFYYYSIVRADGFNAQERAKRKADRLNNASYNASKKSNQYWQASNEGKDFLVLAEPIKIGHHSEKRHRALIERNFNRMGKSIQFQDKAEEYQRRASYWESRENEINLSMPESLEYFDFKLNEAKEIHQGLKDGTIERSHQFSLAYANKNVKELEKKFEIAKLLWA